MYIVETTYESSPKQLRAFMTSEDAIGFATNKARFSDVIDCWVTDPDTREFIWDMIHDF